MHPLPRETPLSDPSPDVPNPVGSDAARSGRLIAQPATDETVKETIESIVIAFILAFMFRAFVVEAFIIPTGSMAPTLLGAHVALECPSCGYSFDASLSRDYRQGQIIRKNVEHQVETVCPMCWFPVSVEPGSRVSAGDRILVDKFLYTFTDPKRWDVIVFKNPQGTDSGHRVSSQEPRTNYIKRLVGLPGEQLILLDGNVYIARGNVEDFQIARKTDPQENPHWEKIQRSAWQPIYHSQYVPLEDARPWDGSQGDPRRTRFHAWAPPWKAVAGSEKLWQLGSAQRPRRDYRFAGGAGAIRFDFIPTTLPPGHAGYNSVASIFSYNREGLGANTIPRENDLEIEDIRLAASVMPEGEDVVISFSTTARLDRPEAGIENLVASIDSNGYVYLTVPMAGGKVRQLTPEVRGPALEPGVATDIELWLVDDEVSVWVGGERVVTHRFDLPWSQVKQRPAQSPLPEVQIRIDSPEPVTLRRVELDRDVYYSDGNGGREIDTVNRRLDGAVSAISPVVLRTQTESYDAEFFVLGDNTPASDDARKWSDVNDWVQERYFGGTPRPHVVPRSLLVGRAFYVYYPAPHPPSPRDKGIIPNFGDMRFIH